MSYGDLTPTVDEQATSIEVPAVSINDYRVMRMLQCALLIVAWTIL
jgi:hypothetical protein